MCHYGNHATYDVNNDARYYNYYGTCYACQNTL